MSKRFICGSLATTILLFCACSNRPEQKQMTPALAVSALKTVDREFNETYPATIYGKRDIDVRPQVSGLLTEVLVDEGASVTAGQTLFVLDQVQFQEAVNVAQTAVKIAELTAKNKRELQQRNVISEYDAEMAELQLAQAKAQLISAQKNLSYTRVVSPSAGIVGKIPFRVGSLVGPSMPEALTTVSENRVVYAYFSLSEKKLLTLLRSESGHADICKQMPKVKLQLADGSIYSEDGTIETISGVIDQATGSVNVRAAFNNKDGFLRSGGTATILIPYTLQNCLVVPQTATFEIQDKKFVYTVTDSSTVEPKEIAVYPLNDGQEYVATDGLKAGDKIVTEGIGTLKAGIKIEQL